jgi:hypothetical protein
MVKDKRAQQHDYDLVLWRLANWIDSNINLPVDRMEYNLMTVSLSLLTQVCIVGLLHRGIDHNDIGRAIGITKNTKTTINRWQTGEVTPDWDKIIILSYIYRRTKRNDFKWRNQHLSVEVITTELDRH